MEKEDNGRGGPEMMDYLRNINTSPGLNAGRSIDPAKPGPDTDRIADLEREIAELQAANEAETTWGAAIGARWECIKGLRADLARLRNEQPTMPAPKATEEQADYVRGLPVYTAPAPSGADMVPMPGADTFPHSGSWLWPLSAPTPEPQDVREAFERIRSTSYSLLDGGNVMVPLEDFNVLMDTLNRYGQKAALAQSDAQPAPPRPDASGLVEAATLLDKRADQYTGNNEPIEYGYRMAARYLRTCAADRSGK
jgi:hypothetical protein